MIDKQILYKAIPAVHKVLDHPVVTELCEQHPQNYVHSCVRHVIAELRGHIADGSIAEERIVADLNRIAVRAKNRVEKGLGHKLIRAINGAGVILHTGLGRAPLAPTAQASLMEAAARYCILATDQASGKRGDRNRHTADMLREITGAEDSLIVNNNSAAVMLALHTFGRGKESIISRGELVEIGGAFRVPDVMRRSQTKMVEIGTTNKTHLRDYRNAITEETSLFLKVHTSNYRIEGFHQEVSIAELSPLAKDNGLKIVYDIGSGALVDLTRWGVAYEPTVQEAVADGADIVTFSGDKLVGGPQCGIIVGKKELIDEMKSNPLMRAFRCDKLIIAALDGTLKLFLEPDKLPQTHPLYAMIGEPVDVVNRRANRIKRRIKDAVGDIMTVKVTDGLTEMGSGALPARSIPSRIVTIQTEKMSAERLSKKLRMAAPPLFTRIADELVIIDSRTIINEEVSLIGQVFKQVFEGDM